MLLSWYFFRGPVVVSAGNRPVFVVSRSGVRTTCLSKTVHTRAARTWRETTHRLIRACVRARALFYTRSTGCPQPRKFTASRRLLGNNEKPTNIRDPTFRRTICRVQNLNFFWNYPFRYVCRPPKTTRSFTVSRTPPPPHRTLRCFSAHWSRKAFFTFIFGLSRKTVSALAFCNHTAFLKHNRRMFRNGIPRWYPRRARRMSYIVLSTFSCDTLYTCATYLYASCPVVPGHGGFRVIGLSADWHVQ